uniref:F-box domain-containing protein n=1 Tax=Steinernema glaseri TaxID=37863 RepID=A0A1I7ZMJ3_9BILA
MERRKNWTLETHEHWTLDDGVTHNIGFFRHYNDSENADEYASFQEFARMDPCLNQITAIWLGGPNNLVGYDYENLCKGTKITTDQDVESLKRRFFSRINYSAINLFKLDIIDDTGLHSAVLHQLVDKQMLLKDLDLVVMRYEGPASIDLLKGLIQNRVISHLHMDGQEWPSERMAPLLEAVIPQRQFRYLSYDAEISLSESFFTALIDDWRNDTMPQKKKLFFRDLQTTFPLASGIHRHPKLNEQLKVHLERLFKLLIFSSVTDSEW